MNKEQAKAELEQLEAKKKELEAILAKPEFDPKKFLLDIFSDFNNKVDREKCPNVAFFGFNKEGEYLFEYDEENNIFWLSYKRIWKVLEKEMDWGHNKIQEFTKSAVEEHFKLKGVATLARKTLFAVIVEEHLKLKGATTV